MKGVRSLEGRARSSSGSHLQIESILHNDRADDEEDGKDEDESHKKRLQSVSSSHFIIFPPLDRGVLLLLDLLVSLSSSKLLSLPSSFVGYALLRSIRRSKQILIATSLNSR
jgi:hypothetical protein